MKENSIEEAKRIIEKLISTMKSDREMFDEKTTEKEIYTFFINALEFILSDYKRVLKENEELKKDRDKFKKALGKRITYCNELEKDLFENCSNYVIPKQIVKDKIEALKNNPIKIKQNDKYYFETDAYNKIIQQVLQELIEEREGK